MRVWQIQIILVVNVYQQPEVYPLPTKKSAKPWFLYIIRNKLEQHYTGIALDWERRFYEHQQNGIKCAKSLKGKGPLKLCQVWQLPNQKLAMQAEIWLKKQNKTKKIKLICEPATLPFEHTKQTIKTI